MAPLLVYLEPEDARSDAQEGRMHWAGYIGELLGHAGLTYDVTNRHGLAAALDTHRLLILPYDAPLDDKARALIAAFWQRGALLALAGTSGLDALFGVRAQGELAEGFGNIEKRTPITEAITSSLHCWGGHAVVAEGAEVLLSWHSASGSELSPLLCRSTRAVLITIDLLRTVVGLQQGVAITRDGVPAPDGSAAIDDGILKADDGALVHWERDRQSVDGAPCFLEPVADEWRDLLVRSIFALGVEIGEALPVLWYWPNDLPATALLSHDTDGNVESLAWQELEAVERCGIHSSWCFIRYPETYSDHFYHTVVAHGHEACLHYDAHSTTFPDRTYSEESFLDQLSWLRRRLPEATIVANKNHFLRWEGWTDAWRWMERAGIGVDQTKGPTKRGNCGFLFGGSHPWFPIDATADGWRMLDVLELSLLAQDQIIAAPPQIAEPLILRAKKHGGVAHFLFHPAHVAKPGVAQQMAHTVHVARQQGIEWWTSDQIARWERGRRQVRATLTAGILKVTANRHLPHATVLLLDPTGQASVQPSAGNWQRIQRWGHTFWRCVTDVPIELPVPQP